MMPGVRRICVDVDELTAEVVYYCGGDSLWVFELEARLHDHPVLEGLLIEAAEYIKGIAPKLEEEKCLKV